METKQRITACYFPQLSQYLHLSTPDAVLNNHSAPDKSMGKREKRRHARKPSSLWDMRPGRWGMERISFFIAERERQRQHSNWNRKKSLWPGNWSCRTLNWPQVEKDRKTEVFFRCSNHSSFPQDSGNNHYKKPNIGPFIPNMRLLSQHSRIEIIQLPLQDGIWSYIKYHEKCMFTRIQDAPLATITLQTTHQMFKIP